jgi:hypothetical protein
MKVAVAPLKKERKDGQLTGLAGEFFVAAELLKRGLQVALTLGNAKSVDLYADNKVTKKTFHVQVKALSKPNEFPISHEKVEAECVYVFVVLNDPGTPTDFYIVPGRTLLDEPERFGRYFLNYKTFPSIHTRHLRDFKDNWSVFDGRQQKPMPETERGFAAPATDRAGYQ